MGARSWRNKMGRLTRTGSSVLSMASACCTASSRQLLVFLIVLSRRLNWLPLLGCAVTFPRERTFIPWKGQDLQALPSNGLGTKALPPFRLTGRIFPARTPRSLFSGRGGAPWLGASSQRWYAHHKKAGARRQ